MIRMTNARKHDVPECLDLVACSQLRTCKRSGDIASARLDVQVLLIQSDSASIPTVCRGHGKLLASSEALYLLNTLKTSMSM